MSASLQDVITQISFSAEHVAASAEELTASVQQANDATDQLQLQWNKYQVGLNHKVKVLKKVRLHYNK